ncbi:hypothetical protein [Larkinella rosea]|uniref:Uncharacterized protein n=1 Tax=Larkinella rosea TaxID=2025312 RepID=A0A3P1BJ60_9BACT|nr:hypothetical protein [Larkinella rosea]RRB01167.1 hypothetical protein EHT25_23625 [Larkinella rosea]
MQATLSPPITRTNIPTYIYAVVFSSLCIVWGLLWDIMWHISIGRDGLFAPPHLLMYVGAVVAGLFSGIKILQLTFAKGNPERTGSVRFWGIFYGSLGAMYCVWGALTMLTSAPFDDWWHNTYGLDVQILTPPHTVLLVGMMTVQFGAMIGVLALQNRASGTQPNSPGSDTQWNHRQAQRLKIMFTIAAGLLLSILYTMLAENLGPWTSHHSSSYITMGIAFPFYLLAVGRASTLRYPITITTLAYMLAMLIPSWILPLFPATPRLGPVLNPITHYQAFVFPLLLVIPGFVLDKLLHRFGNGRLNDWLLSALTGTVFIVIISVVQWYFGGFLQTSPYARNWFFLAESMSYSDDPTSPYHTTFHPHWLESTPDFLLGIGIAILWAIASARIGLLWGNWMKKVQR